MIKVTKKEVSLSAKLKRLGLAVFIPMISLIILMLGVFFACNYQYAAASGNIALASGFSRDFKSDIDLKMYYYATASEYATGLPTDEVETALELANTLLSSTKNKDSKKAILSVINLCDNLSDRMIQIANTVGYDQRIAQLDSNVYILTELIQNYMYDYLYSEARTLAAIQASMDMLFRIELSLAAVATILLIAFAINRTINISRSITKPIDKLYDRVQTIGEGSLEPEEPVDTDDDKLRALGVGFEEMVERLAALMELNKHEQERIRSMELMLLQAQINPHFLYNTLDTIIWLCETGKNDQAVEMVSSLSNFFRTSLSKGQDVITLSEEQLHVKSYLEIQQARYRDILDYDISFEEGLGDIRLPKLTLQPIVENALYHGIKLKRAKGNISITGCRTMLDDEAGREGVIITVSDNGVGMDEQTLLRARESLEADRSEGFGMGAVYKRLKLMFGEACRFSINSKEGEGTSVVIILPRQNDKDRL